MTVTLITGGNKGLGYETARQLIEHGHTVYVGARNVERGQAAASELGAQFVQLDVTEFHRCGAAEGMIFVCAPRRESPSPFRMPCSKRPVAMSTAAPRRR